MDINPFLEKTAALLIKELQKRLAKETQGPTESLIQKAMTYALFSGGKYLRPALLIYTGECLSIHRASLLPFACAIESIHAYSLVHDDLPCMDNSALRRGKPSTWKQFGEGQGVLAGDALLTFAFEAASETRPNLDPALQLQALHALSQASGYQKLILGQSLDLLHQNGEALDVSQITQIHELKTSALFSLCFEIPAILAGLNSQSIENLKKFGSLLGLLFQATDDLLELQENPSQTTHQGDLSTLYSERDLKKHCESLTAQAQTRLEQLPESLKTLEIWLSWIKNRSH